MVNNPPANAGDTVPPLIQEDPTSSRVTKPVHHSYRAGTPEPESRDKRSDHSAKPTRSSEDPGSQK